MSLSQEIEVLTDSAALTLIDEAEVAINGVSDPADAEELWRKVKAVEAAARLARLSNVVTLAVGRVRLRAERRWGELLGPAKVGRPEGNVADSDISSDRDARHKARQVAEVPGEAFERFLGQEEADKLTRIGLLRVAAGAVHGSSERDDWETPQDLFDQLDDEFGFDLDVCALDSSAKCERYFTPQNDGLTQEWTGTCWMNPPYGSAIGAWIEKADEAADAGATVVCLVPARVDTNWWWDHCRFAEIRFLRGRLKFGGGDTSAPFPSAVIVFGLSVPPTVRWWER